MEPISAIATALALGAGAIAKEVGSEAVKDAYAALKNWVVSRYPKINVGNLEQAPDSKSRRAVVEEELQATQAATDSDLARLASQLVELVRQQAPTVPAAIGIDLRDVEAVSLRLADIAASGTGVKVEHGRFSGDIVITGVRAGSPGKS